MNTLVMILLVVVLTTIGLTAIELIMVGIVARYVARSTGDRELSPEELVQETRKRFLGRLGEWLFPLAFWWLYVGSIIWDLLREE